MSGSDSDSSDTISTTTPSLESNNKRSRRRRTIITQNELRTLEAAFLNDPWPSRSRKGQLAIDLNKSEIFISTWFQNKRARIRKTEETDLLRPCGVSKDDHVKTVSVEDKDGRRFLKIIRVSPGKVFGGDVSRNNLGEKNIKAKIWWPPMTDVECTKPADRPIKAKEMAPKYDPLPEPAADSATNTSGNETLSVLDPSAGDNKLSLFESIIRMIALGEGGIINQGDPAFNETVNDFLYGISVNGSTRIVYDPLQGVKAVQIE